MPGLLWWQLSWFFQASFALRYMVDKPDDAPAWLTWGNVGAICAAILMAALGMKWVQTKIPLERAKEAKKVPLSNREDLESRLCQSFRQMEQELVKLVTVVRNHKSKLSARHHGCKEPECERERGAGDVKEFNLVVYDIVEEN